MIRIFIVRINVQDVGFSLIPATGGNTSSCSRYKHQTFKEMTVDSECISQGSILGTKNLQLRRRRFNDHPRQDGNVNRRSA